MGVVTTNDKWMIIDRSLFPADTLNELNPSEFKGLSFLSSVLMKAKVCSLGPMFGQITASYSADIDIIMDVLKMRDHRKSSADSRQLTIFVRGKEGGSVPVCILGSGTEVPFTDDCVSFVLWAESGFLNPPDTLQSAIEESRDPEGYRKRIELEAAIREEKSRIEAERRYQALAEMQAESEIIFYLDRERSRLKDLSWRELMREHEIAKEPSNQISRTVHDIRASILGLTKNHSFLHIPSRTILDNRKEVRS